MGGRVYSQGEAGPESAGGRGGGGGARGDACPEPGCCEGLYGDWVGRRSGDGRPAARVWAAGGRGGMSRLRARRD